MRGLMLYIPDWLNTLKWILGRQATTNDVTLSFTHSGIPVACDRGKVRKLVKMASYENLSDSELRGKLLEIGLDLPVSINREFLIKKLKSFSEGGHGAKNGSRRKSVGRSSGVEKEATAAGGGQSRANKSSAASSRLSLTDISSTGSPKRRNQNNLEVSSPVDRTTSSPRSSGRNNRVSAYGSPPFHSTIIGDDEDEENNSVTTRRSSRDRSYTTTSGNGAGDVSWSKKSDPKEWSRYSSLFPSSSSSPPPTTAPATPASPAYPSSSILASPSTSLSSSLHVTNGNWSHLLHSPNTSSATPGSRLSLSRRSFASDTNNPVTSVGPPAAGAAAVANSHHSSDRGHFISRILVAIAVLFFAIIAILYLNLSNNTDNTGKVPGLNVGIVPAGGQGEGQKSGSNKAALDPAVLTSNYPLCESLGDEDRSSCIPPSQLKNARAVFSTLKDELVQRAKWSPCSDAQDHVPLNMAKTLLYHLSDKKKSDIDDSFSSMLVLCVENPNWGLKIERDSTDSMVQSRFDLKNLDMDTATISAVNVTPTMLCTAMGYLQVVLMYVICIVMVGAIGLAVFKGITYYRKKRQDEANQVFLYVDNILQMLQEQYEHARENSEDPFLAVSHIRDTLVPAQDRISMAALWSKVVDHISNNESRVREEIQHISGEEFRVWRWLPSASPAVSRKSRLSMATPPASPSMTPPSTPNNYNNMAPTSNSARSPVGTPQIPYAAGAGGSSSKWQGQAFELTGNGPNALPIIPTTCLKIRQMFDSADAEDDEHENRIKRAILEKCADSAICHIGVEHGSSEGCVYVKCASKEDARKAYLALHGWWFDGHLLSVKFLREERYLTRFPWARDSTSPMMNH